MSLQKIKGDIVFECDGTDGSPCLSTIETHTSNFDAALNFMKRNRWQVFKKLGAWSHRCPDCQRKIERASRLPYKDNGE
jgi:hypothetical protein